MRIRTVAIALGAVVALGVAIVPAASGATADAVSITSVTIPSPGGLAISVTSDTSLTSLNVKLTSAAHPDALSFAISDFTLSGSDTDGTYTLTSPITDAKLPFDTYTVEITAGDSGQGSGTDSSSFLWLMRPTVTLNASSSTFSYANPEVTFSGSLGLANPDGSTLDPSMLANQTLQLTDGQNINVAVSTDATGAFSTVIAQPESGSYDAEFRATPTTLAAQSPPVTVTATKVQALVSASASATQLNYGQPLTISGTAQYNPGTGFVPLANSTVQIYSGPASAESGPLATVPTDAAGNYAYTFPDHAAGSFYVYAGGLPGNAFLDQVLSQGLGLTARVNVALPVVFTGLKGSLTPFAVLTLKGCVAVTTGQVPPALSLQVEYATTLAGPWHVLATEHGLGTSSCGTAPAVGLAFSYRVKAPVAAAYYRLAYGGSSDLEPAVSKAVHEAKVLTKITNFAIIPRSVKTDGFVTISGRLWRDSKGWHPFANQKIWILVRHGGKWLFYAHKPLTDTAGRFRGRFEVFFSGPFMAEFMGNATHFASASNRLTVTANGAAAVPALGAAGLRPATAGDAVLADTGLRLAP